MVIRRVVKASQEHEINTVQADSATDFASARTIERNRSVVRSEDLVRAVQSLDTTTDPQMLEAIKKLIADDYESRQGGRLVGLFGKCYLGEPFIDHRFDLSGSMILEHFTRDQEPPPPFIPARPFARSEAYAYIEVYDDGCVIPIRGNGKPVL